MRIEEARRIAQFVLDLQLREGAVCLNIGSSTKVFREIEQPHITSDLIRPLEDRGIRFIHCDLKAAEGVDLVGDVLDPSFQERMKDHRADVLFCCNILEHLTDPQSFADACGRLVRPGGVMVVSVPYSYPYHADPIDTMLRVDPQGIASFFPGWQLLRGEIVDSQTFLQESLSRSGGLAQLVRHFLKVMVPIYRPRHWVTKAHRMLWLFRPYRVSVAVLSR